MDDLISRQAAIDAVAEGLKHTFVEYRDAAEKMLNKVPSAEPELIKLHFDHALTEEEIKNLKQKIADSSIVLMPFAQPEQRWIPCSERMAKEDAIKLTDN